MKTGIELDVLVAEKVFGCKVLRATDEGLSQSEYEHLRRCGPKCGCEGTSHDFWIGDECSFPAPYSTDIAAAWEVVKRCAIQYLTATAFHSTRRPTL
ncbi:MAG: hypothetical protein IPJ84_19205 [Bdellovibrionales bacterium]|nr:hypothetical protein [Bdellovibrionales bacterium]